MATLPDEPQMQAAAAAEDFEQLLNESENVPFTPESILQGHVLTVTDKEVVVDFGSKSEGIVPISQLRQADGSLSVKPGDTIEVVVDHEGEHPEGYTLLSHEKALQQRAWDNLESASKTGLPVAGRILGRIKGGLAVDVGVAAFMPGSQVDARPVTNLDALIGQTVPVQILKINRRRGNVVVSRKMAVEETEKAQRSDLLSNLSEGSIVTGTVKNLTEYGAFIDLGGIDGLLHVSDISHGRILHPSDALYVGQEITVKVMKYDRTRERLSLGMKQVQPDPWETVEERLGPNSRVTGRVVSITDYGSFVELEPGVEGLIHISEMTWSRRMKHPSKVVKVGDEVEAIVLEIKASERRISLGIKQLEADPWTTVAERYSIASIVEGRVRKLTDFGAFIEIEEGIDGLVHISDLSWTKRLKHPSEMLKKGQPVQAVILHIDAGNRRLSLGMKQLQPDAWETFFRSHQIGDVVTGRICRTASFGAFVELLPGVEGLCHNTEMLPHYRRSEQPLPMDLEMTFKVLKLSEAEKKIGLSMQAESDRPALVEEQADGPTEDPVETEMHHSHSVG